MSEQTECQTKFLSLMYNDNHQPMKRVKLKDKELNRKSLFQEREMQKSSKSSHKRKKRKEEEAAGCNLSLLLKYSKTIVMSEEEKEDLPLIRRSRRHDKTNSKSWFATNVLLLLLCFTGTAKLLCDNKCVQFVEATTSTTTSTTTTITSSTNSEQLDEEEPINRQRFLDEPRDTLALLGQPADFACIVENLRGSLTWFRDSANLGKNGIHSSYSTRYSIVGPTSAEPANYSLHIKSVALRDESSHFHCFAGNADQQHRNISSRHARLTVVQPPTRLLIFANPESQVKLIGQEQLLAPQQLNSREGEFGLAESVQAGSLQVAGNLPASSQTSADGSSEIVRVVAKQGTRLRLECRADLAKPRAELIWLDHQQRPVNRRDQQQGSSSLDESEQSNSTSLQWEELSVDPREPKLVSTTAIWSFIVDLEHANQPLTCQAQHLAFEQQQSIPELFGHELKRQVLLDVLYEPKISLVKDAAHVYENSSLRLQCQADGNPAHFTYRWFIDNQPVGNRTGSGEAELVIERVTRQLHLREIKCQVSNAVGVSSSIIRLPVRYAPVYATHLMPSATTGYLQQRHQKQHDALANEQAVARQLAIGVNRDQDVTLHCDFDSYPQVKQVLWFKVPGNEYNIMREITPTDAADLIEFGASRAIFRGQTEGEFVSKSSAYETDSPMKLTTDTYNSAVKELDYEFMSRELLSNLANYETLQELPNMSMNGDQQSFAPAVQVIANETPSFTTLPIREPLQFELVHSNQVAATEQETRLAAQQQSSPSNTIRLLQPARSATLKLPAALQRRDASLSSSSLQLNKVNEESVGRYICKAQAADNHSGEFARSIYLVLKEPPRIISVLEQSAPLAAQYAQVECLAQINTNQDAFIRWFKDGKPILSRSDPNFKKGERTYVWNERKSPDLLFLRSIVRIDAPQLEDFGQYICNVLAPNSNRNDTSPINLKQTILTSFIFNMMALLTIGSILVIVCVVALLIACAPCRRLDLKEQQVVANGTQTGSLDEKPQAASPKLQFASQKQNGSIEQSLVPENQSSIHSAPSSILTCSSDQQASTHSASFDQSDRTVQQPAHKLRSSLRQPTIARSAKFAAIHESLEHKLNMNFFVPFNNQMYKGAEEHQEHLQTYGEILPPPPPMEEREPMCHQLQTTAPVNDLDHRTLDNYYHFYPPVKPILNSYV